jgi:plasmid stability protein
MAQLLVRDIEPKIIERLKERARQHKRSLQGEAKSILEEAAERMTIEKAIKSARKIRKSFGGKIFSDSAELIREDRER